MKRNLLTLLMVFLCLGSFNSAHAVQAIKTPITVKQPDGTELTTFLRGDEFKHYQTTLDGYLIKEDGSGYYKYATINQKGQITLTDVVAKNPEKRQMSEKEFLKTIVQPAQISLDAITSDSKMQRTNAAKSKASTTSYPLNGSPKSLVILANFSDQPFVVSNPLTAFQNLLTQSGYSANGGTGSAKDYFISSSYGKFSPDFVVVGPVTLPQTLAYYGTDSGGEGNDQHAAQMIVDACAAANAVGLDFTQFDTDGNGYIDNVFVYYAGYNQAEGAATNTIWPHRWSMSAAKITTGITFDGKKIEDYACTSELRGNSGSNMCGIGTFCHEFGHVLGLPDLYNTNNDYSYNTMSYWDIMDSGPYLNSGRTPPSYSSYERFFLGWLVPTELKTAQNVTLENIISSNIAYLVTQNGNHNLNGANPSPVEFFMFENRQKSGWDAYLPGHGLLVTHVYYNSSDWTNNNVNNNSSAMGVDIVEADGVAADANLAGDTYPGTSSITSYTPKLRSGTSLTLKPFTSIAESGGFITFKFMGGAVTPTLTTSGSVSAFSALPGTPSATQSVGVTGTGLTDNVTITLSDQTNFDIKLSTSSTWGKSATITQTSGSASATLNIRYNPVAYGSHSAVLSFATTGVTTQTINLSGVATNPSAPSVILGKVDNQIVFPGTTVKTSKVKTINIKTTDVVGTLTLALTGTNASLFTVSSASLTKDAVNAAAGANITITYAPVATGAHTATLTISGGGLADKVITLSGTGE